MNSIWGDVPTWVLAIATPLSILVGFWIAKQQIKQTSKIEEHKIFREIDKNFRQDANKEIQEFIYQEVYKSKTFQIINRDIERKLYNYLNDLEYVCNLYLEGLVSKKQLDFFMGLSIVESFKSKSIREFIKSERKLTQAEDLWIAVEKVAKEFDSTLPSISTQNEPTAKVGFTSDSHGAY